jgi:exonuclease SbcC
MIPKRVKLKGFLCYKDEQEVSFDGAALWMLAGRNGSGKSSVFDAVTYALFGQHRGGGQDAHELINKDSDRAAVEFDFVLDGQHYQAYRTIQLTRQGKAKGTQQMFRRHPDGTREAIPGTNLRAGFDGWVAENISLGYDTFTSSVLLLQGKADRLLDSTAKGRHEVLAGIVDLERYRRLHQRADEERKQQAREVEHLGAQLAALAEVSPEALVGADARIAAADAAHRQAHDEVDRLQALLYQARRWAELQIQLADARRRWQQAQELLADAPAIERAVQRQGELRAVLPRLETVLQQHAQVREADHRARDLTTQRQQLDARHAEQDHSLAKDRQKRAALQTRIAADEQRQRDLAAQHLQAAGHLPRLREYERQEADLSRLEQELARLPADPVGELRQVQQTHDTLAELAQAVPLLARFQAQRAELRQAREKATSQAQLLKTVQERGEQLAGDGDRFKPRLDEAARARQQADEEATRAGTLRDQAREQAEAMRQLQGAKLCRSCGQTLTPQHVHEEQRRRDRELAEAEQVFQQKATVQEAVRRAERELRQQLEQLNRQLQEAREEFRDHRRQAEQARQDTQRLERECAQAYHDLADPVRLRVSPSLPADWLTTVYPRDDDLALARSQAAGLGPARQRLRAAEQVQIDWNTLKGQEAGARQALARLQAELPPDRAAIPREHVRLESETQAVDLDLRAQRAQAQVIQEDLDRQGREREQTRQQLAKIQGELQTEEATRKLCRQALDRLRKELPESWQSLADRVGTADVHCFRTEMSDLIAQHTDERGQQLREARAGLEVLREAKEQLEAHQDQFSPDARQDAAHIQELVQTARQACAARDEELVAARLDRLRLNELSSRREELNQQRRQAEAALAHSELLATLLGRDRLQLHLVRQAERQVVDYANAVLDRLSGGQLFLKLRGEAGGDGTAAKALELEAHNRSTGELPINVAFLSGSQKFRVAVSLALGIGQYASRRHRPIESVIIDEGFGCLDKVGRQAMIQEMQNLRGQLKCILLVSHQEEFADAFADGYYFELKERSTRATRFQR